MCVKIQNYLMKKSIEILKLKNKKNPTEKFSIIGNDIHRLVRIKEGDDISDFPWITHETDDWYWVPVPNEKRKQTLDDK